MRLLEEKSLAKFAVLVVVGLFALSALAFPLGAVQQGAAPTVDEVIQLHKAGISEGVLITRIKQTNKPLQLSTDELLKLSQAKVPERVIQALMDPSSAGSSAPLAVPTTSGAPGVIIGPNGLQVVGVSNNRASGATTDDRTAAGDPNDPMSAHDSGIYLYFTNKLQQPEMKLLEPAAYSGGKTGGFLKSSITYGLAKVNQKAIIQGAKASIRAVDHRPVFYFYFEDRSVALGKGGLFGGITSPNQFVALKLEGKKTTRETVVMEIGAFGTSSGTKQDAIAPFKSERLKPGLYKVTFEQDLKPGEYCFLVGTGFGGAAAAGAALPLQIFDFSVPVEY